MTGKADFTPEEWKQILEGPPSAGMLVAAAQRGGTFRESFAMAKAYTEARKNHGDSELLDEIVSTKPKVDRTRYHSAEELQQGCLNQLTEAVGLLEPKATTEEVDDYKGFVLSLAARVANAHEEDGKNVSDAEQAAIDSIAQTLGKPSA